MKSILKVILLSLLIIPLSCEKENANDAERLPTTPINLLDFNSQHDDYNSTAPTLGYLIPFCFSTNRNSAGGRFDVMYMPMNVNYVKSTEELTVTNQYANWSSISDDYEVLKLGVNNMRTNGNDFGPNLVIEEDFNDINFTIMYSSDVSGNSQISFVSNLTNKNFGLPQEVDFLNSEFEDLYPTFNSDRSKIYFCSNRNGGSFNFYHLDVDPNIDSETLLSDSASYEIKMDSTLSSSSDDKCPIIFNDIMVFTSNRPGGFGGYDLYYSRKVNNEWTAPVNFGAEINSESDEFRPILIDEGVSQTHTMMVFSSDRPGGLGGFDLYFVGVELE